MSTIIHLRCVSHDPPVHSDEVGHNESYLPQIREDIANRQKLVEAYSLSDMFGDFFFDSGRNHQLRFMYEHPNCDLEIWNEYGDQYPLVEEKPKEIRRKRSDEVDTPLGVARVHSVRDGGCTVVFSSLTDEGRALFDI